MKFPIYTKINLFLKKASLAIVAVSAILFFAASAKAQVLVYTNDFDVDDTTNWVVNVTGSGYSYADFFFNYTNAGVPPAPHSIGGTTRGLKLGANLGAGGVFPAGVSVSPLNFGIVNDFDLRFDLWMNFNKSGNGSTEQGGAGYGTAGTAAQVAGVADSVYISVSTDAGSSADYRVYSPAHAASYQDADHSIASDPNSPLVYAAGSRNNTANYYVTNFPATPVPPAQTNLFATQTGSVSPAGNVGYAWHDVSLKQVGNTISFRVDNVLIATVDRTDAGALAGTNILFNMYDINAGGSTDPTATNVLFTLIDNVRVFQFTNVITLSATTPQANETPGSPGVITVSRPSAGSALTVFYSVSGTATSGVDYTALPGSITFAPGDTTTNIIINPIDDSISEPTETVTVTLLDNTNYAGLDSAQVSIFDNDLPMLSISAVSTNMYEGNTNDYVAFKITRLGNINSPDQLILDPTNFVVTGGTATSNVDYYITNLPAILNSGDQSVTVNVLMPINDNIYEGNETITLGLRANTNAPGAFAVSTNVATVNLIEDDYITERVLFSDSLSTDTSNNWKVVFVANNGIDDKTVAFAYPLVNDGVPNAPNGSATALKLTVNKDEPTAGGAAALNLYPIGQTFSNNYALRVDLFAYVSQSATTEYSLLGINHSGNNTNWLLQTSTGTITNWNADGYFFGISSDGSTSSPGDYVLERGAGVNVPPTLVTSATAAANTNTFKVPPFQFPGAPGNQFGGTTPTWVNAEVRKINNTISLRLNGTTIISSANATNYSKGDIMLGYVDPYESIGAGGAVYYSNLRVVDLTPKVTSITNASGTITITFLTGDQLDTTSTLKVQSATSVTGPYTDDGTATITQTSPGVFQATVPASGAARFYRIRHV